MAAEFNAEFGALVDLLAGETFQYWALPVEADVFVKDGVVGQAFSTKL